MEAQDDALGARALVDIVHPKARRGAQRAALSAAKARLEQESNATSNGWLVVAEQTRGRQRRQYCPLSRQKDVLFAQDSAG